MRGPHGALLMTVKIALLRPPALGRKVTLMAQLPCGATLLPQLLVWAKSALLGPLMEMRAMIKGLSPRLASFTACGLLVVQMSWGGKVSMLVDNIMAGTTGILVTKASVPPLLAVWKARAVVGKLVELV